MFKIGDRVRIKSTQRVAMVTKISSKASDWNEVQYVVRFRETGGEHAWVLGDKDLESADNALVRLKRRYA